MPNGGIGIAPS